MERDNFQMPTLHGRFQILKENSSWKIHLIRDIRERRIIVLFCYCAAQILSQTDSCSIFLTPGAHNYQFYFNILSAHYIYFHLENFWVFFPWGIKISTLLIKLPRIECGWLGVLLWNIIVWKDVRQLQKKKKTIHGWAHTQGRKHCVLQILALSGLPRRILVRTKFWKTVEMSS